MTNATVRVRVDENGRVTRMAVAGRPKPHTFGRNEGSHVTPWAVFADTVRRGIVGHRAKSTIEHLRELVDALDDTAGTEAKRLPPPQQKAFNEAADAAWDAIDEFEDDPDPKALERAIAHYLTARNLAPLTAVYIGPDDAKGRGEGTVLNKLRAYEEGTATYPDTELAKLLATLLDTKAIELLGSGAAAKDAPGATGTPATDMLSAVTAHLSEVSRAYPLAYEAARMHDVATFNTHFSTTKVQAKHALPKVEYEWGPAARDWSPAGQRVCLVDLTVASGQIASVEFEGRGNTLLNEQGHHVTAHVAVEAAVRATILDRLPKKALSDLIALCDRVTKLATWQDVLPVPKADPKAILAAARVTFDTATASARLVSSDGDATEHDYVTEIESLAGAYVMMRNALPMAAVRRGALANAKGEGRAMTLLNEWVSNSRRFDRNQVCWTLWRLFDGQALQELADRTNDLKDLAPLAPAEPADRICQVLSVHLDTVEAAFPTLAQKSFIRSVKSVAWVLKQYDVPMPSGCAKLLNLVDEQVTPKTPFKEPSPSEQDEDEWKAEPRTRRKRGRQPRHL